MTIVQQIEYLGRAAVRVAPEPSDNLPTCLFLYGGGGSHRSLIDIEPLLAGAWNSRRIPRMALLAFEVDPFGFYLEADEAELRADALLGISMGGHAALRAAFANPGQYRAVVALQPMIEPGLQAAPRNRFHYPPMVPQAWFGPERDPELFRTIDPAERARRNAPAIRESEIPILLEVGGDDLLNAHDGTEYLHRVLWDLDIDHEYHLVRGADHVGASLPGRLLNALAWLGHTLTPTAPSTDSTIDSLRAQLRPAREAALHRDPTLSRRYGRLPPA